MLTLMALAVCQHPLPDEKSAIVEATDVLDRLGANGIVVETNQCLAGTSLHCATFQNGDSDEPLKPCRLAGITSTASV